MLFHSSPELAETVAAERNRELTTCAIPVLTLSFPHAAQEVLQLTQHSMLINSVTLPKPAEILLLTLCLGLSVVSVRYLHMPTG
jgi:hypothetical protein